MTNEKVDSFTSKDGCKYSIDCPLRPRNGTPYCCGTCRKRRKSYINDSNKHLWTDERGFHSKQGCKLPRDQMPKECIEYDCRRYPFYAILFYENGKWQALTGAEIHSKQELSAVTRAVAGTMELYK